MVNAVLVTDMLRGFLEEGCPLYCGAGARRIIPAVQRLLAKESNAGSKIFYVCDYHDPNDLEFKMFPPHCIEGTTETEVIPELAAKFPGEIIKKKRYSAFAGTNLGQKIKKLQPKKIIIVGVCTDICVCHTAADARSLDYNVEVPADCVASFDERAHVYALEHMEKVLGVNITYPAGPDLPKPKFKPSPDVISGDTADIYFPRTIEILNKEGINPVAVMEIFGSRTGVLCGIDEAKSLLKAVLPENSEVWALDEGVTIFPKQVVLRIKAPYQSYGLYETAILGMLSHSTGWATAARECVAAAGSIPVISFGARHVHPSVAGVMDYAAVVGGCRGCSSVAGGKLTGLTPSGTMPHALILIVGDTVKATMMFDKNMPPDIPRVSLVDTFLDEAEESLRVAAALGNKLNAVRLDTPHERGGVTLELVKEVRARLDQAGFNHVGIFVSGGFSPDKIKHFVDNGAPVVGFGVGSYISGARPIDFTADLHEVAGKAVAKRGRIPGITPSPGLERVI